MEAEGEVNKQEAEIKKETDVSDAEMAQQYALTGTIARKFHTKKESHMKVELDGSDLEPQMKKPKFLKPMDWSTYLINIVYNT